MPAVLTVNDAGAERRIVLEARAVVGRDPDCDVVLSSRSVSRKHAIVEKRGESWVARDLGSANGLFVEGKRVAEAALAPGASLRFGDVEATFAPGAQPTPSAERLAQSLSVAPSRRARPLALGVVVKLSIAALVAATVWARYCDGVPRAASPAAAPAHG